MPLDHPVRRVARWRFVVIALASLTAGVVSGGRGDWNDFVEAGRTMFGSAGLHVYVVHRDVQTGPLSLLLAWLFGHTPRDGFVLAAVVCGALGIGCIELLDRTTRPTGTRVRSDVLVLLGGCLTVFSWAKLGGYGHLDDAITLTCAVIALHQVRAGRPLNAGLAIGIAIATKPWGVIFLPITLATRRRDLRAPALAVAIAGVAWLPFIISAPDSLRALRPTANVTADSVMALFGVTTDSMPDWVRVAQLIGCLLVASALAKRGRPELIIAAAVAVRVATDPATWSYYTPGLVIGVLVWDLLGGRELPWATLAVIVGLAPTWLVPSETARGIMRLAVTAVVVTFSFVVARTEAVDPVPSIASA